MGQLIDPATWLSVIGTGWSDMGHAAFWVALLKIIWINILLSGDNAVVIAMACRGLPRRQRVWGMVLGAGVAVVLRIIFTAVVASLMLLPWLKIVGGLALFYIAVKLLVPEDDDNDEVEAVEHLWRAVRIVAIADIVMSLDNVIAIAAAAQGNVALLVIGLAHQHSLDRGGGGSGHGPAGPLSDPGLGRRGAARMDRRRGHRDRCGHPWISRTPVRARGLPLHRALLLPPSARSLFCSWAAFGAVRSRLHNMPRSVRAAE